jgi:nitrite reductase/ring-hydroxylating ferredoxin subunit
MKDWPEWQVCRRSQLGDPGARGFEVGGGTWPFRGFVLQKAGALRAFANICPHLSHPLDMLPDEFFAQDSELLKCMSHGALFDPESGLCLVGPCAGESLLELQCRTDGDAVWVSAPETLQEGIALVRSESGRKTPGRD